MGSSLVTSRNTFSSNSSGNIRFQVMPFPNNTHSTPGSADIPYVLTTLNTTPNVIIVHEFYDYTNGGAHKCSFLLYAEYGFSTEQWIDKFSYIDFSEQTMIHFRFHQSNLQVQYYFNYAKAARYYLDNAREAFLFIAY